MKTILLMRHAKASWDRKEEEDCDRQVTKKGKKDAERIGEHLKKEHMVPEIILCSAALRARQTAEGVMKESKFHGDLCFLNKLYMGEPDAYVAYIQALQDDIQTALVIGHNPTLDGLLQVLTGKVETLSTSALANLCAPIESWKDFTLQVQCELVSLWRPKEL